MHHQLDFHLFGDCFIETPVLSEQETVSQYLPLLRAFDEPNKTRKCLGLPSVLLHRHNHHWTENRERWDLNANFEKLVEQDTAAWKRLGVNRAPHFTQPSGSIQSPLALHIFNPTFYVTDPQSAETDYPTSPTIQLLRLCGLSSAHCFIFDHICRRDRTDDCLYFYTEDMRQNHRDFVRKIRQHMFAAVEICFGEHVFNELRRTARLVRFPLWGTFKPVRLWLELDASDSLKRLIIQTYHPQDLPPSVLFSTWTFQQNKPWIFWDLWTSAGFGDLDGRPACKAIRPDQT